MPQLACNPIIVSSNTQFEKNTIIPATLMLEDYNATQIEYVILKLKLRSDNNGFIKNYDISPLVSDLIRQRFNADYEYIAYGRGVNNFRYTFMIKNVTVAQDLLLFGGGLVPEILLYPPFLLRRNNSTIHIYGELPGEIAQYQSLNLHVYSENFEYLGPFHVDSIYTGSVIYSFRDIAFALDYKPGRYFFSSQILSIGESVWRDSRIWNDNEFWIDNPYNYNVNAIYPVEYHEYDEGCLRSGAHIYVRYWNSRGAWSYALLYVKDTKLKSKATYENEWVTNRIEFEKARIIGNRVMTDQEMTHTITAGMDMLNRLDVEELQDLQRAYCIQMWDVDYKAWKDCYVQDTTTANTGGSGQEITFTFEMPSDYTFTR